LAARACPGHDGKNGELLQAEKTKKNGNLLEIIETNLRLFQKKSSLKRANPPEQRELQTGPNA